MMPEPSEKAYPPTLHLVSRQLAQSESLYPTSVGTPDPPRCRHIARVPLR
jgi:hypothetical protein